MIFRQQQPAWISEECAVFSYLFFIKKRVPTHEHSSWGFVSRSLKPPSRTTEQKHICWSTDPSLRINLTRVVQQKRCGRRDLTVRSSDPPLHALYMVTTNPPQLNVQRPPRSMYLRYACNPVFESYECLHMQPDLRPVFHFTPKSQRDVCCGCWQAAVSGHAADSHGGLLKC